MHTHCLTLHWAACQKDFSARFLYSVSNHMATAHMHYRLDVILVYCMPLCLHLSIYHRIHVSIYLSIPPYWNSFIYLCFLPFAPMFPLPAPPLVGARGSGSPLISSQNKQPGKHHETFKVGRAAFSLIHSGNPEMHKNSCSQSSTPQRDFNSYVHTCTVWAHVGI